MFTFCPSISRASIAALTLLILSGCKTEVSQPAAPTVAQVSVAVPARAGAVEGKTENSDAFIWELFTQFTSPVSGGSASPVAFETWASDEDTFNV
jgi:hypothetical protein